MMTPRRRLLAYAKQTSRKTFTPAQLRRVMHKARRAACEDRLEPENWADQDHLDADMLTVTGRNQHVFNEIVLR